MSDAIGGSVPSCRIVNDFMHAITEKFKEFDKTEDG